MREYFYLNGLDESPYQLTLLDALHLGATEHLGTYVLITHDITLKEPATEAEEPGKGLHLKLCASTLQQMEKDASKAKQLLLPGTVGEKPRLSQCYSVHEAFINYRRFGVQTNESTGTPKSDRLVSLHYPNGDPFIACLSDLIFWTQDLEQLANEGRIQRRADNTSADQMKALPDDFRALYEVMADELPHLDLLITAWRRFWKGRRPNDGRNYPLNSEVADWVINQMEDRDDMEKSNSKANTIASIIRPKWAPPGRQPNRDQ
mgnify:CR=1 FL=1